METFSIGQVARRAGPRAISSTPKQMRHRYQQADVTLFTSMIEHEAFGLVPLEAMASGCPVIATGVGGSGEYWQRRHPWRVTDGVGLVKQLEEPLGGSQRDLKLGVVRPGGSLCSLPLGLAPSCFQS